MIPRPPIHAVNWRHIAIERERPSTSVSTVAPEAEKPDIDSKNASTGRASCGSASRYGSVPNTATSSHRSATTR